MNMQALVQFIRNRVSIKLGLLLLFVFLLILFSLGNILYSLFLTFYLSHVNEELVQRANSHANVLSDHFEPTTIQHVVRMEKGSRNMVVILDQKKQVIASSSPITSLHREYLKASENKQEGETSIEKDWNTKPFLVSYSPVLQNREVAGTVVMFSPTAPIREAVNILQQMLVISGIITVFVVAGILFIISRMLVRPLLEMKKATGEIAQGNYATRLPVRGGDEVAQLAASINHMSDRVRFYQKQRNEFLADVSHELRTPLTYLKGYSEILAHSQREGENAEYAKIIYEQSNRLQRLVQDLFDLARMEQGDFSFRMERFSLEDAVTDALSLVEVSVEEKGLRLEYRPFSTSLYVEGDRQRIGQVLLNVLENARRYTPSGGIIFVRMKCNEHYGIVEIEDTGPGIPEEDIPYIMERLYRVEKSRSQVTGGAGLGLAISKEIIEKHKGTLQVKSVEGEGTTFVIKLPLYN
ncbi:sensor histidine kinase [Aneurinibacillus thermoaerophilus]|uniref:histidine kinase n=1 Tax=Aneurinibacillus thermoaerophilus TaxID=143495 RepID=A0ABX8YGR1_ANETH|nr:HAMP domain-containing sensor histidine kinase [Aneurinibacillus thermoaerophilus]QYY44038.1 HAMP domain-containing histidine kinase [Aneurinibacillus thermoaerophilus]